MIPTFKSVGVQPTYPAAAFRGGDNPGLIDGLGLGGISLSGKSLVTRTNATPRVSPTGGVLSKMSGSSSGIQIPLVNWNGYIASITGLVWITSQNSEMIWEHSATADTNSGFYLYGLSSSTLGIRSNATGGSAATASFSYTFPNRPVVITMRLNCAANPHNYEFWAEGVLISSGGIPVTAGTYATATLNIGCRNGTTLSSDGAFGPIFLHNSWMPAGQLLALHRDIYAPFARIKSPIPFMSVGTAVAPSFKSAWAVNANSYHSQGASNAA